MSRQGKGLWTLGKREAMTNKPFQMNIPVHHEPDRLRLKIDRRTVGPDQGLFVYANGRRIN